MASETEIRSAVENFTASNGDPAALAILNASESPEDVIEFAVQGLLESSLGMQATTPMLMRIAIVQADLRVKAGEVSG